MLVVQTGHLMGVGIGGGPWGLVRWAGAPEPGQPLMGLVRFHGNHGRLGIAKVQVLFRVVVNSVLTLSQLSRTTTGDRAI